MQASLDDERAIAHSATEGLTLATRGRVYEQMAPYRARSISESRRETSAEIDQVIGFGREKEGSAIFSRAGFEVCDLMLLRFRSQRIVQCFVFLNYYLPLP